MIRILQALFDELRQPTHRGGCKLAGVGVRHLQCQACATQIISVHWVDGHRQIRARRIVEADRHQVLNLTLVDLCHDDTGPDLSHAASGLDGGFQ